MKKVLIGLVVGSLLSMGNVQATPEKSDCVGRLGMLVRYKFFEAKCGLGDSLSNIKSLEYAHSDCADVVPDKELKPVMNSWLIDLKQMALDFEKEHGADAFCPSVAQEYTSALLKAQ